MPHRSRSLYCLVLLTFSFCWGLPRVHAELTQEQITTAKSATGLLLTPSGFATAFCVSESGIFITSSTALGKAGDETLSLILDPAGKDPQRYPVKVLRTLKGTDLTWLKVAVDKKITALPLGDVSRLFETRPIWAFGYPSGKLPDGDLKAYPAISVNMARIMSLRKKGDTLSLMQFDGPLNRGNIGGPVLDSEGKVVGIVSAGVVATGRSAGSPNAPLMEVNGTVSGTVVTGGSSKFATVGCEFAVPISQIVQEIDTPVIEVDTPKVKFEKRFEPVEFTVAVDWMRPPASEPAISVELSGDGEPRKVEARKGDDGKYRAQIAPCAEKAKTTKTQLQVTLEFDGGQLSGTTSDLDLAVAGKPTALREFSTIERPKGGTDFVADGKPVGALPELAALPLNMNGTVLALDAQKANKIALRVPPIELPTISFKALLTLAGGKGFSSDGKALNILSAELPPTAAWKGKSEISGLKEYKLPSSISDVAVAQNGRALLLYMKESKKLAVFDVVDLKIRGYINLAEDRVLFAGGSRYILILNPTANLIQRYSVETLQKERTINNSFGNVATLTMGYASPSIALMCAAESSSGGRVKAFDVEKMAVVSKESDQATSRIDSSNAIIRASADGRTFGVCRAGTSPSGFSILTFRDNTFSLSYEHQSVGILVPNADGAQIFSSTSGIYTNKFVPVLKTSGNWNESTCYLPSYHPMYFISAPMGTRRDTGDKQAPKTVGIYLTGSTQSLLQMSEEFSEMQSPNPDSRPQQAGSDPMTPDKRYHFFPQLDLFLTIPPTNDKIVVRPLNVRKLLAEKGIDYLYVTSLAPLGKVSTPYHYQLETASKAGGVKCSLQSGPSGLTVDASGAVAWNAPAQPVEETVIVALKDASGQEAFHTFRIAVTE